MPKQILALTSPSLEILLQQVQRDVLRSSGVHERQRRRSDAGVLRAQVLDQFAVPPHALPVEGPLREFAREYAADDKAERTTLNDTPREEERTSKLEHRSPRHDHERDPQQQRQVHGRLGGLVGMKPHDQVQRPEHVEGGPGVGDAAARRAVAVAAAPARRRRRGRRRVATARVVVEGADPALRAVPVLVPGPRDVGAVLRRARAEGGHQHGVHVQAQEVRGQSRGVVAAVASAGRRGRAAATPRQEAREERRQRLVRRPALDRPDCRLRRVVAQEFHGADEPPVVGRPRIGDDGADAVGVPLGARVSEDRCTVRKDGNASRLTRSHERSPLPPATSRTARGGPPHGGRKWRRRKARRT